jgi:cytochrome c-type biogenesis protein CcmH/NrfG
MLFDLRGRGRRRAVQAIYLSLALLMGGGLVLFGVGGASSGGLLDAFTSNSGQTSVDKVFQQRVDKAEAGVRVHPTNPKAWAELTRVRFQQAGSGDGFDPNQGAFTDKGKAKLQGAASSWDKYLTLTDKPDDTVAALMVQAFGTTGLNQPAEAVNAMEIIIDRRPETGPLYVQLASLAYQAGQTRKAQLASKKALSLTPKDDREQIQAQLDGARQAASTAAPGSTATPSS